MYKKFAVVILLLAILGPSGFATTGTAIWRSGNNTIPQFSYWNGSSFIGSDNTADIGLLRIMAGAEAPTRDEIIVVGVDENRDILGMMWDGTSWAELGFSPMNAVTDSYWWGFDVAYESQSGNAVMVVNNGATDDKGIVSYYWNNSIWAKDTITTPLSGEPKQMRIASNPNSDEMVLVASNSTSQDYAIVWDGSAWGNPVILSSDGTGDDRTDIYVAYEQQSGDALAVYGKGTDKAYFRKWNGSAWSAEDSLAKPGDASGIVRWTTLDSDPGSNRIALGVVTLNADIWLNVWDGTSWETSQTATNSATGTDHPCVAVAFEGLSVEALAVYGDTGGPRYRTWDSVVSWTGEVAAPTVGVATNTLMLDTGPGSNNIMLSIQDDNNDLNFVLWNGNSWGSPDELENESGDNKNQPFVFLWDIYQPQVYYVSTTGNDNDDGLDSTTAWATVDNGDQKSILRPGDTVVVLSGEYILTQQIHTTINGTKDFPIHYLAEDSNTTILNANGSINIPLFVEGNHTYFSGFEISNSTDNAVHIRADSIEIRNCKIKNSGKFGIRIEGAGSLIYRNIITYSTDQGIKDEGAASYSLIHNNTIYGGLKSGLDINNDEARVFNNIISDNTDNAIQASTAVITGFNCFWNNGASDFSGGVADSARSIYTDPLFADTASNDFGLQPGSPCIDTALDLGYPYIGSAPDMGAIEYVPHTPTIYWVSPTGNDNDDGLDSTAAWASIDNGDIKGLLGPGDTVYVLSGVYPLTASAVFNLSGTEDSLIVYRGYGPGDAIFDAGDNNIAIFDINADYTSFEGLLLRNSSANGMDISGSNNILRNCIISRITDYGVNLTSGADSNKIYNNTLYATANAGIYAVSSVKTTRIFNNIIDSTLNGIWASSGNVLAYNNLWRVTFPYAGSAADSAGGISVDPQFVNSVTDNFYLQTGSLCIDSGLDIGYPFIGTAPDMGAIEHRPNSVYWVSPTGNDDDNGLDSTTAWATIDNGDIKGLLGPGDTINVLPGTYSIFSSIWMTISGTASAPITYRNFGDGAVIVDANGVGDQIIRISANHTGIDGLEFTNCTLGGISLYGDSCIVTNCFVHDVTMDGFYVSGSYNLFLKNILIRIGESAVDNTSAGIDNRYYGNTISSCSISGIYLRLGVSTARIFNNIVCSNNAGIDAEAANVCGFNDVWDNPGGHYIGGAFDSADGISVDPLFINKTADDFRLQPVSPCIDAGLDLGYSFNHLAPDMGALETGNRLPVLAAIDAQSTTENINLNFGVSATDIESTPVLTTSALPTGASFLDNGDGTGTFDWTPTFLQSGDHYVTFYATDDSSAVDSETVTITVNEAGNQEPVLAVIGAQSTTENVNLNFGVSASDAESTPVLTTSGLPTGASFLDNGDGTGTFDWTPTFLQSGDHDVTFYATDDSSAVDSETVTITVNEAGNQEPVLTAIGPRSTTENVNLNFSDSATDIESTPALTTSALPTGASFLDNGDGTGTFDWTPTFLQSGDYDITFYATDDSSAVDSETVTITVNEAGNQEPVLTSIGPRSTTENVNLNFSDSATDIESTPTLTTSSLPTGATFLDNGDGTGTFDWTPTFLQSGDYEITFYVTDDSSAVDSETVTITVIEAGNQEPILAAIGPQSTTENINLNFSDTATDIESIPALTTSALPTGASFLDNGDGTGTFDWTPTFLQSGDYDITFYATDDSSAVDSETVTITVIEAGNQEPILTAIGPRSTTENVNLNFSDSATDIESTPTLTTSSLPTGATFLDNGDGTGTFDWTPIYPSDGNYDITFYATDDSAAVDSETVTISVSKAVLSYLVISPDTVDIGLGDSVQFTATGYDADSNMADPGELTWTAFGRSGVIDSTGLYIATQPGRSIVSVISSINATADSTGFIDVEELYLTTLTIGNIFIRPNSSYNQIFTFRIDNYYDDSKEITGIDLHDASLGAGSPAELLSNLDSIYLYYDKDYDSLLSAADSIIASAEYFNAVTNLSFPPVAIGSYAGKNFIVGGKSALYPRDGDSLDIMISPALDITTLDATVVTGPDSANSMGYGIYDGLVAKQVALRGTITATISPEDNIKNMLTIDIPQNGYQIDTLKTLSIINTGTAVNADFDSLTLYEDNGNNIWNNTPNENHIGKFVYTGEYWTLSGINVELDSLYSRFYIGADISSYPTNNSTISLTVPKDGIEMASQNDGPIDSALTPVDTIEIVTFEEVTVTALPVPSLELVPGGDTNPLLGIELTNSYGSPVVFDSLLFNLYAVDPVGATQVQLDSQIDSVMIYLNRDNNHVVLSGLDSLLAVGNLNNGTVVFDLNGFTIPAGGVTKELCFVAGMNLQNSKNGNLINIGINDVSDIYLSVSTINGSFPVKNNVDHIINSFTALQMTNYPVEAITLFGGQTEQLVFDFELPRDGYDTAKLKSMVLENVGTVNDLEALENVQLWSDLTNDGFTDDDSLLGNFTYNSNQWELFGLAYQLNDIRTRFFVTVDVINEQFEGGTLQFRIPIEGVNYWSGTTGPDDTNTGNPDAHLVFSANRVTVISLPAFSVTLSPGTEGTTALTFALYNSYVGQDQTLEALTLSNISQTSSSQAFSDYELGQVYLYLDSDSNRILSDDSLVAVGYFANGSLQLAGLDIVLTPEVLSYFFVVSDIPRNITDSDSLAVAISNPSDFVFSQPVNINGDLPVVSGGHLILDGSSEIQYELIEIQPKTLSPGDTSVTLFAFHPAFNGELSDVLQSLTIANLGNADTSDITPLELWLDTDNDSVWQDTDSLVGVLTYSGTEWHINSLNLIIDSTPPALFLIGDVTLTATSDAVFQSQIPIDGCQYSSDNDGPYDESISSPYIFTISNSGLRIDYTPLKGTFSVGQSIEVKMTVTNLLIGTTMDSVYGEIVGIDDSTIVTLADSVAGPISLSPGESTVFTFTYTADSPGLVSWDLRAVAPTISDTSVTMRTNQTKLQTPPMNVPVELINFIPTSVTKGQVNVFPMGLSITHPDTSSNAASLRLDSLLVKISDGMGMAQAADDVFNRMVLTTGYVNLSILESVPTQSTVSFTFTEPVIIDPGETQVFSLLVDIDSTTILSSFAMLIEDITSIPVTDNNTLQLVTLDAGIAFPLTTASCNIVTPSHQMAISYSILHTNYANYNQDDVEIMQLKLFHPGDIGSSWIQLTGFSFKIIDGDSIPILPSNLLKNIKLKKQGVTIASLFESDLDTTDLDITLNAPIILNPGERDSISIMVSLKDASSISGFNLLINDSTDFVVRDHSSGLPLDIATDTTVISGSVFPIYSGLISVKQPALAPEICVTSLLPFSIIGGVDSLELIELSLVYPPGGNHSPVRVNSVLISALDSTGIPLDPNQLFDRIGTKIGTDTIVYMPYVETQGGYTVFNLGDQDLLLNSGDSATINLVSDIEIDVPSDNFVLKFYDYTSLVLFDETDTTYHPGFTLVAGCSATLPFTTNVTMIFLPAGRPVISSQSRPVQIAYPGQLGLNIYDEIWSYSSPILQGDLALHGIQGQFIQRTESGVVPVNGNGIFETVYLLMDNQSVAIDSVIADDTLRLIFDTDYVLNRGDSVDIHLECDLKTTAAAGNYFIQFNDSTFMNITDKNLANVIYPILNDSYPVKTVEISVASAGLERSFTNYPNPFNPIVDGHTNIAFNLSEAANIDIEIFTITGEIVSKIALNSGRLSGSHQSDTWEGTNDAGLKVISGTYLCRITARYDSGRSEEFIRKIAVIR